MKVVTTVGLDIAKSVFQVHGVDSAGQVVIRRQLKRRYVLAFFEKLPACLVGIEACASSHDWSRELKALGHTVRLMPPAYVKTLRQTAEERCHGCGGNLRSGYQGKYAVRRDQDARAAERSDAPSHAPSIYSPADRGNQCDPGSSHRVRDRRAGRAQGYRGAARCCRQSN